MRLLLFTLLITVASPVLADKLTNLSKTPDNVSLHNSVKPIEDKNARQ